jgi:hypothetical protein
MLLLFVQLSIVVSAQKAPSGDIWLHMITTGEPADTKYLGDQLNPSGTWYINFEVGQISWNQTDAGIGSDYMDDATWTWRTANWYADGSGNNKQVRADFGNFRFTQAGYWYIAGRAKGESTDPFHYANSIGWGNATTLEPIYYFQVDVINIVPSAFANQNVTTPSTQIDLEWTKNEQGHNVMIVRKKSYESWTEPTQGTPYAVNATIGSGVVVYNSGGTAFTNEGLASSTDYDYKFYSVNNNYYSDGEIYPIVASTYTAFASGDGTTGDPFQVANADALNCARHYTSAMSFTDGNFIQTADIDLGGVYAIGEGWLPIDELRGSYNGQGHTISNLTINRPTNGYVGLFSSVSTGIISNLGLINVNIIGYVYAGSFAASMSVGITPTTIQMDKCYATGAVSILSGGLGSYIGGLVGHLAAPINRCYSTCTVNNASPNSQQFVGGLVGAFDGTSNMTNCYATGAVTAANNNFTQYIGGLVGWANGDVGIQKSFATGLVTCFYSLYLWSGGLVGRYDYNAGINSIENFYDEETTGQSSSMLDNFGRTSAEMKTAGTFLAANWDFSSTGYWAINGTTNNGYPYLRYQGATPANIWNGATSTDWNEPENWNDIAVPASDKTVIIPAVTNDPVIGTAAVVTNLTIETGGSLTVSNIGSLTVSGILVNNQGADGLIVKADITGFGSLIENNVVPATVESYLPGSAWHFISSPVSGLTSSLFETKYLQQHTEAGGFVDVTELGLSLAPARGFALYSGTKGQGGIVVNYIGQLNAGTMPEINVTRAAAGVARGWNLIGNPYASVLDWDLVGKTNVNTAIYIENAGDWAIYNNGVGTPESVTGKIAPGQGFFVQVTEGQSAGTVSIANNDRVHSATTFYKSSEVSDLIRLQVSGNGFTDEAVVRFATDATSGFDGDYDAHKFFSEVTGHAQVYTIGNTPLAINALQTETSSVPLGIRADVAGTYSLSATDLRNIPFASLEDTKTGIFTDLSVNAYTFNFEPGENELRFILHFGSITAVNETPKAISAVYSYHKTVVVNMTNQVKGDIYIYNLAGQLVVTRLSAQGKTEIDLPVSGNYIVKAISKDNTIVRKVFIP